MEKVANIARRMVDRVPDERKEQLRERWIYVEGEHMYHLAAGQEPGEPLLMYYENRVRAALRANLQAIRGHLMSIAAREREAANKRHPVNAQD